MTKQASVALPEGASIILFFLALGITKFPTQRKKIIFREKYEKTIQE
jgi:hypothetical protein